MPDEFSSAVTHLHARIELVRKRLIYKTDSRDLTVENLYRGLRLRKTDKPKKWLPAARQLWYAKIHLDTAVQLGYGGPTLSRAIKHLEASEKLSLQTL